VRAKPMALVAAHLHIIAEQDDPLSSEQKRKVYGCVSAVMPRLDNAGVFR